MVKVQEATKVKAVEDENLEEVVQRLQTELDQVRKVQKKGKYRGQHSKRTCKDCTLEHNKDTRCPVTGKECRRCDKEGHFSRSSNYKGKDGTAKRVQQDEDDYSKANWSSDEDETVNRVMMDKSWLGSGKERAGRGCRG